MTMDTNAHPSQGVPSSLEAETDSRTTGSNPLVASGVDGASVSFRGVVKEYGGHRVLHGLDLDIAAGEFVSLLGPSGCGKTTALRVLAGLESPEGGVVSIGGTDVSRVPTNKRDLGMVFQAYSLFPHLTALENTMFGLGMRKVKKTEARERAVAALELVGLQAFGDRYPAQLSGGQQQRVALARALVTEPRVLLLDEPLSALDAKVRVQLRDEIRRIQLRLAITTVFVTHDQEEALAVSDRIAVMNAGRIEQIGSPEDLYRDPATTFVADFVGLSSVVPATAAGGAVTVFGASLPMRSRRADGEVEVLLRPENVRIATDGRGERATVLESTFLGSLRRTRLRTDDGVTIRMQHSADERLSFGDVVRIEVAADSVAVR
ncbi:ABC transporter ATP-binding protein [Labedella phragmitis]|nr:ABC transporter ATP-binding protein [Labedella phragmitis]